MSESKRANAPEAQEVLAAAKGGLWSSRAGKLIVVGVAAVLAVEVGFRTPSRSHIWGQPGLLIVAMIALCSGAMLRRMLWGALAGVAIGFLGGLGMALRLTPYPGDAVEWYLSIAIFGEFGAIVSTISGAISGGLVELFRRIAR